MPLLRHPEPCAVPAVTTSARHTLPPPHTLSLPWPLAVLIALALCLLVALPAQASEVTYRVTGVASNDVLNVRDRAGVPGSRIIGILPPGTRGVVWDGQRRRSGDGGTWWRIHHPRLGSPGWVNARFLTEERRRAPVAQADPDSPFMDHTAADRPYRVTGVATNDVLNIRAGPGTGHRVVGGFAPHGRNIWITGRGRTLSSGAYWVEVVMDPDTGRTGWVNSRFLTPM